MMLWKTTGDFQFMIKIDESSDEWKENQPFKIVKYTDLKDIPEDFEYIAVIKFVADVPQPPHSVQEHEQMMHISDLFQKYLNATSSL